MASEDQMLPIHKIDDELVPVVLNHVSDLKSSIPEIKKSLRKYLEWFEKDFVHVKDAIVMLKEKERLLNVQMKVLVCVLDSMRSVFGKTVPKDPLPNETLESSGSQHSIRELQIKKGLSKLLPKTLTELKETLNLNARFNLRSYVESKDQRLAMHKIDDELMPAVLNHVSKLRSSISESHSKELKDLDGLREDLFDVRHAIGRLKETERLINDQMKELVCVDLNDISNELNATAEERQRAAVMDFVRSEFSEIFYGHDDSEVSHLFEPSEVLSMKSKSGQIFYSLDNPNLKEIEPSDVQSKRLKSGEISDSLDNPKLGETEPSKVQSTKSKSRLISDSPEIPKLKETEPSEIQSERSKSGEISDSLEIPKLKETEPSEIQSKRLKSGEISNSLDNPKLKETEPSEVQSMRSKSSEICDSPGNPKLRETEPSEVQSTKSKSGEIYNSLDNPISSELAIHPDQIENKLSELRKALLKLKEIEPFEALDHPKSSELATHSDQIENELAQLQKTLPKLKETLNLIPKVSPSANDTNIQNLSLTNPNGTIEAIKGLDMSLHLKMPHLSTFKEFQILYDSLDPTLKLCLLCFSAFLNNSVINKRALIYWWIGEGFVESFDQRAKSFDQRAKTVENTADEIFQQLMSKGFIEPVYQKRFPVIHRYKMHPFIRFMVVILAQKAGFFDIDSAGNFSTDQSKSLKACLVRTEEGSSQHMLRDSSSLKKLDTLFNVNESHLDLQSHWFSKLKVLRILQLGRWQSSTKHHIEVSNTDFLKSLSNMKYLRYLSLQGISRIPELPVPFSNLTNMKVLNLRACHNLQKLPNGIGKLKNLTHLDMSECYLIGHMPQELASLTQLQVLKGFVIDETKNTEDDVCRLTKLSQNLTKLRKLSLYISGEPDKTKNELFENLPHFTTICSLTIAWVGTTPMPPQNNKANTATTYNVHPLQNLEKLDLRCFPWPQMDGPLHPNNLTSLKKLYIRGGELRDLQHKDKGGELRDLQHKDNPWIVEILRLKYLCKLGMSWEKLREMFPKLTYLEKVGCPNLSLFPCDGSGVWMKNSSDSNQG